MTESVRNRTEGKKVVIWGMGTLQQDLEAVFPFLKPAFYVDARIQGREKRSTGTGEVYGPWKLEEESSKRKNRVIILCKEESYAAACLEKMGYSDENYLLGKELLADISLYRQISKNGFSIWGIGNTYYSRERDIHEYLPDIRSFIETKKTISEFQGKKVYAGEETGNRKDHGYIAVASVYYEEICKDLTAMGLKQGEDFAHVDTVILLGKMARMEQTGYHLDDRRKNTRQLTVVLAGYKEFVWDTVFPRLKAYIPPDMDVCVVSSGLTSRRLSEMCRKYGWSYMSVEKNNVSIALNLAIREHPKAEDIYKLDEDIFVTSGVFEAVKAAYEDAEKKGRYQVGFATPLIPVNGYGHARLLEILDKVKPWEERFGTLKYGAGAIYWKPEAARFMWELGLLDDIGKTVKEKEFRYSACPVKYSIGFILFQRRLWNDMGMFPMLKHKNVGVDEDYLCGYCMNLGMSIVVAENAVAGHLSYGPQNREMEQYYREHKEAFCLRE